MGFTSTTAGIRLGTGRYGLATRNERGYIRIFAGSARGRYQHRLVVAAACAEFCYYPLDPRSGLPSGFHVEHLDHCRTHNCLSNLLLLQAEIHNACTAATNRYRHLSRADALADMVGRMRAEAAAEAAAEVPF